MREKGVMKASVLMAATQVLETHGDPAAEIKGLVLDSRQVKPGQAFFALPGSKLDGGRFIQDALTRGAAMVVTRDPLTLTRGHALFVRVGDVRQVMAEMAAAFYGYPARRLRMLGITGTNGKTTTANMARNILQSAGLRPGMIGTIRYEIGDRSIPAARTTPEAIDLHNMLAQMVNAGCQSAIMEVSSHGLVQRRTWGIDYDVAVFTNLTHDHLDYHQTVDGYYEAKSLLFRGLRGRPGQTAVINLDDRHGARLLELAGERVQTLSYGIQNPQARIRAVNLQLSARGSVFEAATPWGTLPLRLRLLGRFNVYNALAALGACAALGVDLPMIAPVLNTMGSVPGRLEEIESGAGFQVFVDYAHTADALQNVLSTMREITAGRLIVVFGCGGDRDRRKRPLMGAAAAELADYAIVTSDNPRKETPSEIIAEVRAGFAGHDNFEVVEDRYEAIVRALSLAERGDVVVIAGKGHENYQEFADTVIPFDDRQVVRECLGIKT